MDWQLKQICLFSIYKRDILETLQQLKRIRKKIFVEFHLKNIKIIMKI